jgi:hypothetical protein
VLHIIFIMLKTTDDMCITYYKKDLFPIHLASFNGATIPNNHMLRGGREKEREGVREREGVKERCEEGDRGEHY